MWTFSYTAITEVALTNHGRALLESQPIAVLHVCTMRLDWPALLSDKPVASRFMSTWACVNRKTANLYPPV